MYHSFRVKVEKVEEEFLKIQGTLEIQADMLFFLWIAITITFKNILKTAGERYHLVMAHPFVGVENQFFGAKQSTLVKVGMKVMQNHMLSDDFADLRVAEIDAYLPADFRMMAAGFNTQGLGDIMKQGPGYCLFAVGHGAGAFPGSCQAINQCSGNPGDEDGVLANIIKHAKLIEAAAAFSGGGNLHGHVIIQDYRLLSSWTASTAIFACSGGVN